MWSLATPRFWKQGLEWRSSVWFATLMVSLGITGDILVYSIVIPVLPFRLETLGYDHVSSRVGWLIFAYSAGLVMSTLPIAWFSENYSMRRTPMITGLVALLGSQVMLMEAPTYWLMCLARILQGISSSMVWVVGLALLSDTVPERMIGRQLGIAMSGISVGLLVGPPVGGVLYARLGYRSPFIFALIFTAIDLIFRFLFIERKDALKLGIDPARVADPTPYNTEKRPENCGQSEDKGPEGNADGKLRTTLPTENFTPDETDPARELIKIPLYKVIGLLCTAPRAVAAFLLILGYGVSYTMLEPTLPLQLQAIWGFDSSKVGLVLLASTVPALFSSPLSGWIIDIKGTEWLTFISIAISLPWWTIIIIPKNVALFIFAFAIISFFTSAIVPPVTAELAAVSKAINGVGYAHVYGAFNIAYGVGSAIGPLIGGQVYGATKHGWTAICFISLGTLTIDLVLSFFFVGEKPLSRRLTYKVWPKGNIEQQSSAEDPTVAISM